MICSFNFQLVPSLLLALFAFKYLLRKWRVLTSLYARFKTVQLLSRKHRTLSLQICARQTVRLTIELWTDAGTCVAYIVLTPVRDISRCNQRLETAAHWHMGIGQAYHKTSWTKQLVNGESGCVQTWGKKTSLWTSAKLKPALSDPTHYITGSFQSHQQSTEENTLFRVISVAAI